jgi:transcription elongation factor/antiterminator RfaH
MINPPRWYVVRTKPKQETRVEVNLGRWGIEVLAPKVRERRSRDAGQTPSYTIAPLFPNYVFAHFEMAALLVRVRLTRGVHSVLGFGEPATAVDDSFVSLIRSRIGEDGCVRIEEPKPGDAVRIVSGSLRALTGVFERRRAHQRVVILLGAVAAQPRVEVAIADVEKIADRWYA